MGGARWRLAWEDRMGRRGTRVSRFYLSQRGTQNTISRRISAWPRKGSSGSWVRPEVFCAWLVCDRESCRFGLTVSNRLCIPDGLYFSCEFSRADRNAQICSCRFSTTDNTKSNSLRLKWNRHEKWKPSGKSLFVVVMHADENKKKHACWRWKTKILYTLYSQ